MKTIKQWKEWIKKYANSPEEIKIILDNTLRKIKFLEEIYMTGGKQNIFSENFSNCAYTEREELCQQSSACYSILRDDYKIKI